MTFRVPGADHTDEPATPGGQWVPVPDAPDHARMRPRDYALERGVCDSDQVPRRCFWHAEPNQEIAPGLGVPRAEQARDFGQTAHDPSARASGDHGRGPEMIGVGVGDDDLFYVAEAEAPGAQH